MFEDLGSLAKYYGWTLKGFVEDVGTNHTFYLLTAPPPATANHMELFRYHLRHLLMSGTSVSGSLNLEKERSWNAILKRRGEEEEERKKRKRGEIAQDQEQDFVIHFEIVRFALAEALELKAFNPYQASAGAEDGLVVKKKVAQSVFPEPKEPVFTQQVLQELEENWKRIEEIFAPFPSTAFDKILKIIFHAAIYSKPSQAAPDSRRVSQVLLQVGAHQKPLVESLIGAISLNPDRFPDNPLDTVLAKKGDKKYTAKERTIEMLSFLVPFLPQYALKRLAAFEPEKTANQLLLLWFQNQEKLALFLEESEDKGRVQKKVEWAKVKTPPIPASFQVDIIQALASESLRTNKHIVYFLSRLLFAFGSTAVMQEGGSQSNQWSIVQRECVLSVRKLSMKKKKVIKLLIALAVQSLELDVSNEKQIKFKRPLPPNQDVLRICNQSLLGIISSLNFEQVRKILDNIQQSAGPSFLLLFSLYVLRHQGHQLGEGVPQMKAILSLLGANNVPVGSLAAEEKEQILKLCLSVLPK